MKKLRLAINDVVASDDVTSMDAFLFPPFFTTSVESELGCSKLTCGSTMLDFLLPVFLETRPETSWSG